MEATKDQVKAVIEVMAAVGRAVKELGEVPSGHLYARLMETGMSLDTYQTILGKLEEAGLIRVDGSHLIRWIGP